MTAPFACPECGGGLPDDNPKVCRCGTRWDNKTRPKTGLQRKTPLKQGSPLKRGKPLKQTSSLKRTGPIARTAPIAKTSPATRPTKRRSRRPDEHNDIPAEVRAVVLARCQGRCEACGDPLGTGPVHMHHRKRRTKRNHVPCNIIALHPTCHVLAPQAVHQRPAWAAERGLIVRSGGDPATTPLVLADGRRVLLDPEEPTYRPAPLAAA